MLKTGDGIREGMKANFSDPSVILKMCERSHDLTKNCLALNLTNPPFEAWIHVCMVVEHKLTAASNNSRALFKGYINGKLQGKGNL